MATGGRSKPLSHASRASHSPFGTFVPPPPTGAEELAAAGLGCHIIPRKTDEEGAISASDVRCLIQDGNFEALKKKVPACTFQYFTSEAAEPVIQKIRAAAEVRHY